MEQVVSQFHNFISATPTPFLQTPCTVCYLSCHGQGSGPSADDLVLAVMMVLISTDGGPPQAVYGLTLWVADPVGIV